MMSSNQSSEMNQILFVSTDQLVPKDHLLRKVADLVDFNFVYDLCKDLYSEEEGRPSIDPVILVKLALIQKLFGIRSMRKTISEVEVNVAYRWFLGYTILDPILHFGTFSKNYVRRFKESEVFRALFENVLDSCIKYGGIDPQILFVDATHVKAHANKNKNHKEQIQKAASWYVDELEKEIGIDRQLHGKKDLPKTEKTQAASITVSDVDPESGLFHKGEHKEVFAYNVQTACDKNAYVLEYSVHPGNDHDSKTFPALYEKLRNLKPEMMVLDAGYKTPAIARQLLEEEIKPIFPYTRPKGNKEFFYKKEFVYDEHFDCYLCPNDHPLKYSTTNREGYREYKSDPNVCKGCPDRDKCTKSKNMVKVVTRHVWQDYLEEAEELRYLIGVKEIYSKRKETIERIFGLSKEVFGFRYTMLKGKRSMEITAALTYAAHNLRKLISHLDRTKQWDQVILNRAIKTDPKDYFEYWLKKIYEVLQIGIPRMSTV